MFSIDEVEFRPLVLSLNCLISTNSDVFNSKKVLVLSLERHRNNDTPDSDEYL